MLDFISNNNNNYNSQIQEMLHICGLAIVPCKQNIL